MHLPDKSKQSRLQAELSRIREKYGLDADDSMILELANAEREIAECETCTGEPCKKSHNQYFRRVIKHDEQFGYVVFVKMCEFGKKHFLRSDSKSCEIPPQYAGKTFNDYKPSRDNERALKMARWFVEKKPPKSLYFHGECGTGKTFLASLIAQEFILDGKRVEFGDVPTLLDRIKQTFNTDKNAQDVVDRYCDCDLLVLDDIGAGQVTEWNIGILYQIINRRYNAGKPLIVTSNFDLDVLESRLAIKYTNSAKRITSRLCEMCMQAFLGMNDRRKQS